MAGLSESVRQRMRHQAQAVREQQSFRTARVFDLAGKNAVIKEGEQALGRVLPRWDIAQKFVQKDGQWSINPDYQDDLIYFPALEHWWDGADGKPNRAWCLKNFDAALPCPLCEASEELQRAGDAETRKVGKRIMAKKLFLFNFIFGRTGKRALNEQSLADIGVLPAHGGIFAAITGFMTGGLDDEEAAATFARGDITDPREGYDILLKRPQKASGERWSVDCAPNPSPLYAPAEAAAFAGWMERLVDLPAMVERELVTYDALYEKYYGQKPDAGGGEPGGADDGAGFVAPSPAAEPSAPQSDPWGAHISGPSPQTQSAAPPFDPPPGAKKAAAAAQPPRRPSGRR